MSTQLQVFVRQSDGRTLSIDITSCDKTVGDLKDSICTKTGIPQQFQHLIFESKLLDDEKRTLKQYGISHFSTVHLPISGTSSQDIHPITIHLTTEVIAIHQLFKKHNNQLNIKQFESLQTKYIIEFDLNKICVKDEIISTLHLNHISNHLNISFKGKNHIIEITLKMDENWCILKTAICDNIRENFIKKMNEEWLNECEILKMAELTFEQIFYYQQQIQISMNDILHNVGIEREKVLGQDIIIIYQLFTKMHDMPRDTITGKALQFFNRLSSMIAEFEKLNDSIQKQESEMNAKVHELVKNKENELLSRYEKWTTEETIAWLKYLNGFDNDEINKNIDRLQGINVNGATLYQLTDLSLKLIGINNVNYRNNIIDGIDELIQNHGGYISIKTLSKQQLCLICMVNDVNAVCIPCGHLCFCNKCGETMKNENNASCPICRNEFVQIVTIYRAGMNL